MGFKAWDDIGGLQHGRTSQIAAVSEVGSSHHVLGIKQLLCQFWNRNGAEGICTSGCQRSEADHEEVQTREGYHVYGKFTEV